MAQRSAQPYDVLLCNPPNPFRFIGRYPSCQKSPVDGLRIAPEMICKLIAVKKLFIVFDTSLPSSSFHKNLKKVYIISRNSQLIALILASR